MVEEVAQRPSRNPVRPRTAVVKDDRVTAIPTTIPHGRTAQRLTWPHLPPAVRALVEERCGSPVVDAVSQGGGFTPGFASVLTCADGSKHFVKAASAKAQRRVRRLLPRGGAQAARRSPSRCPHPRLLWVEDGDWVVLETEYVEARPPRRPWRQAELDAALDALEVVARELTPGSGRPPPRHRRRRARRLAGVLGPRRRDPARPAPPRGGGRPGRRLRGGDAAGTPWSTSTSATTTP